MLYKFDKKKKRHVFKEGEDSEGKEVSLPAEEYTKKSAKEEAIRWFKELKERYEKE